MAFFHPNFLLQSSHENGHNQTSTLPPTLSSEFHGMASLLEKRSPAPFLIGEINHNTHGEDELSDDDVSQAGEKKRRLNTEQVKTLEKNFELGNKLEPERKMQLARALGLQPRQIAIWFQNRRARWKTKQLEKDYELLKRQFDAVKSENDQLQAQNQKFHAEILALKNGEPTEPINLNKETECSCSNGSENSSEIKLDISRNNPAIDSPLSIKPGPIFGSSGRVAEQVFFLDSSYQEIRCPKMDESVKEESLSNVFCGVDDQTGFWPWLEHQHLN